MAADNRSITITIKADNTNAGTQAQASEATISTPATKENDKTEAGSALAAFAAEYLVKEAVSQALNWGEYYWNLSLSLNDDYIGQRNKNIAMTQINRAIGAASGITNSAISGFALGGAPGAIIGGIIGVIGQTVNIINSNKRGEIEQDITIRKMDAQLDFTRSRAGWSTQAASIGEDL